MHFNGLVGNPPYQGDSSKQLYPGFYKTSKEIADNVCLIFPDKWQEANAKPGKGLGYMYTKEVRCDNQIVSIENLKDVFKGVQGAQEVNIILWAKGSDNGLNGKQLVKGVSESEYKVTDLSNTKDLHQSKATELLDLYKITSQSPDFIPAHTKVSKQTPYGMKTNIYSEEKDAFSEHKNDEFSVLVYGGEGRNGRKDMFMRSNAPILRQTDDAAPLDTYKVLYAEQWGNLSPNWVGGSWGDIIIASPFEICTQKFHTAFPCSTPEESKKAAKYLSTRFCRAHLMVEKTSKHTSKSLFKNVPLQDFHEDFWNSDDIDYIDECLFDKYGVPENIREFVRKNIQPRTIDNIENYHTVK